MRARAMARAVPVALLLSLVAGGAARAAPSEAERVGRSLADAVFESAREYARIGRRDRVDCEAAAPSSATAAGAAAPGGAGDGERPEIDRICAAERTVTERERQVMLLREESRRAGVEDAGTT